MRNAPDRGLLLRGPTKEWNAFFDPPCRSDCAWTLRLCDRCKVLVCKTHHAHKGVDEAQGKPVE